MLGPFPIILPKKRMNSKKSSFRLKLSANPEISFLLDVGITFLFFVLWYLAFHSRQKWIQTTCMTTPSHCSLESLNWLDRLGLIRDYHLQADQLSYWTQYAAGALALICFLIVSKSFKKALGHVLLLLQCTALNGALMEGVRLVAQRPRPFVYLNPLGQGGVVAHYTSFYSGHTSFAALASTAAILSTLSKVNHINKLIFMCGLALTVSTAALRVYSGRHFITDVVTGALAGVILSLAVNSLHHCAPRARLTI
jgi:membrane-associated phospholipid phosphatase